MSKKALSFFSVGHQMWAQGLHLRVVCLPSETHLEKTKFSIESVNKLEKVSWLRIEGMRPLFLSSLGPNLVKMLITPAHATSVSASLYVC